jgi:hypothetical protein
MVVASNAKAQASPAESTVQSAADQARQANKPLWRNFAWQLLVLILLPVLFLAAWFVLSSPQADQAESGDGAAQSSPEIEMGEPVPPGAIVSPAAAAPLEAPPIDEAQTGAAASPAGQSTAQQPAAAPPAETSAGSDAANPAHAAHSGQEVVPPDMSSPPPQTFGDAPPARSETAFVPSAPPAVSGRATHPWDGQAAPAFQYPSTDPSTFEYPDASAARVGMRPGAGAQPYPSTGAPPHYGGFGGSGPGAQPR